MRIKTLLSGLLLLGMLWTNPAAAEGQAPSPVDQGAVQSVIDSQIRAFLAEDGEKAFSFAAPIIKQKFGNASNFMRMVEIGYPPVYAPQEFSFGKVEQRGDQIVQEVLLTVPDGSQSLALYKLQKMEDGSWKINAVFLRELPDQVS